MKIVLKGIPPSLNKTAGRGNRWDYRADKAAWTNAVYLAALQAGPERFQRAAVTICYYFPTRRRRDPDNYCGKYLLDGLTKAGIIPDDDFAHITLRVCGGYDKANPRTEIYLENI